MSGHIEKIAGGMIPGADHVVDAIVICLSAARELLPITRRIRMGGDFCIRCLDFSVGLMTGVTQRMRHRRPGVFLDLRGMANLAATGARRFGEPLWLGSSARIRGLARLPHSGIINSVNTAPTMSNSRGFRVWSTDRANINARGQVEFYLG
jgi:hypothetical protein